MKKKRNIKKNVQILAVAALTATLMAGQIPAGTVWADNSAITVSSLIPDNVTVEQPVSLSEISLPGSEYGTLSWVDSSSVPSKRVQSYDVVFRPYNSADLSRISGWDGQSDAIYGTVTVVVSSLENDDTYSEENNLDSSTEDENNYDQSDKENSEVSEDPSATEMPSEETETPATEETPAAEVTETPETTEVPKADITETPAEVTETPEVTEVPTDNPAITEMPDTNVTETPAEEVTETPEATVTPEATATPEADKDNIFDGKEKDIKEDTRSQEADDNLTDDQKEELASENHSCNGISVSGINLPWYVQFRVSNGDNYEFTNEEAANVFKSYEFELWDLKNNTEYQIPDGEYISVTVPVKAGYDYTIEHLLDSGAMETIVPSVDGSTMVFSTHSFSPFGIAGSKALVGQEIEDNGYGTNTTTTTTTPAAQTTASASQNTSGTSAQTSVSSGQSTGTNTSSASSQDQQSTQEDSSSSTSSVNTGDNTPILPFVLLGIAAVAIIGVIIYLRKRK